jgi:hypothetical protein
MGEVCICDNNEVLVMLVSLAELRCGVGGRRQPTCIDRVIYIHKLKQRAVPTFACKLSPSRLYRFVPVDSSNICCTRKIDSYLDAEWMGFCVTAQTVRCEMKLQANVRTRNLKQVDHSILKIENISNLCAMAELSEDFVMRSSNGREHDSSVET